MPPPPPTFWHLPTPLTCNRPLTVFDVNYTCCHRRCQRRIRLCAKHVTVWIFWRWFEKHCRQGLLNELLVRLYVGIISPCLFRRGGRHRSSRGGGHFVHEHVRGMEAISLHAPVRRELDQQDVVRWRHRLRHLRAAEAFEDWRHGGVAVVNLDAVVPVAAVADAVGLEVDAGEPQVDPGVVRGVDRPQAVGAGGVLGGPAGRRELAVVFYQQGVAGPVWGIHCVENMSICIWYQRRIKGRGLKFCEL